MDKNFLLKKNLEKYFYKKNAIYTNFKNNKCIEQEIFIYILAQSNQAQSQAL